MFVVEVCSSFGACSLSDSMPTYHISNVFFLLNFFKIMKEKSVHTHMHTHAHTQQ